MVTLHVLNKLRLLPPFPALLKLLIIPYMHALPLTFGYHCCRGRELRALSDSLPALCLNFVSDLNQLPPIDPFALFHSVDI
jgi:hypothetical protein